MNDKLTGEPGLVNAEPTGAGWLCKMKIVNASEVDGLLDQAAYNALIAAEESH